MENEMSKDAGDIVKGARQDVDSAIRGALSRGVLEEQLMQDVEVQAARERLTDVQTSEHLKRLWGRNQRKG